MIQISVFRKNAFVSMNELCHYISSLTKNHQKKSIHVKLNPSLNFTVPLTLKKTYVLITPFEIQEIKTLFRNFKDIFYKDGDDLTFTNDVKHSLQSNNSQPIYTKIYRYPHPLKGEVDKQINEMLETGIIRHSNLPYNAPIWVVPKKLDASAKKKWRMVIDYRKLNDASKEDKYPIPNIDDILSKLGKCNYFTVLDLA